MDRHGIAVAGAHKLTKGRVQDHLLKRLDDNESTLLDVRNLLVESIRTGQVASRLQNGCWIISIFWKNRSLLPGSIYPKEYGDGLPCLHRRHINRCATRVYDIVYLKLYRIVTAAWICRALSAS